MAGISRRDVLIGAGALSLGGCSAALRQARELRQTGPVAVREVEDLDLRRLHRIGYGPTLEDLDHLKRIGWAAYVEEQLTASRPEPEELAAMLRRMDIFSFGGADLRVLPEREILRQLSQAALLRAIYSPNQLRERMVGFWSDHFNIDAKKAHGSFFLAGDQNSVIRPHAMGSFPKMLNASAHSPAMLTYLDNRVSSSRSLNENYGRELLELHSLGVHGGYTQNDVREVARCFTGWSNENRFLRARGSFRFIPDDHDSGPKTVLGRAITASGKGAGDEVLNLLAEHPSTAKHIGTKIARAFLGNHAGTWPDQLAKTYTATEGDISAMLREILLAPEFGRPGSGLVKRPFDFVVSAIRGVGAITDGSGAVQEHLDRMRQPLYQWPMPDGYPTRPEAWHGSLLGRWAFAVQLAYGAIPGVETDLEAWAARTGLPPAQALSQLLLGAESPASQDPREALALILASPAYQTCA